MNTKTKNKVQHKNRSSSDLDTEWLLKHLYTTTKNQNERQNKFNALVVQNILFHFSYIQFSNVCATVVRRCLKPEFKADAEKRGESLIKITKWVEGKPEPSKFFF